MRFSFSNFFLTLCTVQLVLTLHDVCRNQAEYKKVKNEFTKKRNEIDGAFPWTVVIFQQQKPLCLGSLLAMPNVTGVNETNLVLTASGCIERQKGVQNKKHLKSLTVRLGGENYSGKRSDVMRSIIEANSLIINDDFDGVGVIKMKRPFSGDIRPICLPDFGSTLQKLNKCFLSALGTPTTYLTYKIRACEKDENAAEKNTIEMCYMIKEKAPLLTYGSMVVCNTKELPFAFGITRKSKPGEVTTERRERRVHVSTISRLKPLYSLPTLKEPSLPKVAEKIEQNVTVAPRQNDNTTNLPFKAKEFKPNVTYKRPIIIRSFNWSLPK